MILHKIFHMNQSVGETKRRLSNVSGYRHHLDGVEQADFNGRGSSTWRLLLPLGFRADLVMAEMTAGEDDNTLVFKTLGGDLEVAGVMAFHQIKPNLTEVDLTVNYESTSPLFNLLDRMLNVGDQFLVNQLRRVRAHFEGVAAPVARTMAVYDHQLKHAAI